MALDIYTTPPAAIDLMREQCNRYANGQCMLRKCLVRGGYTGGAVDRDVATCEHHEAVQAFEAVVLSLGALTNACQIIDVVRQDWSEAGEWSDWDQQVREQITGALRACYAALGQKP